MAEPTPPGLKYYGGSDGAADDASSPYGGAIDTGAELSEAAASNLVKALQIPALGQPDLVRYGAAYRKLEEGGSIEEAAFYNRAGAVTNDASGIAQVRSTSALDTGSVRIVGKESGDWQTDPITSLGTTTANGDLVWDAETFRRAEYLDEDGEAAIPVGNIAVSIAGQLCAVIFGSGSGYGNYMASTETSLAVATAKDSTVGGADWETSATGVGTYANAVYWGEDGDTSIPIPSGEITNGEYCGYSIGVTLENGIPRPVLGKLIIDIDMKGRAVA